MQKHGRNSGRIMKPTTNKQSSNRPLRIIRNVYLYLVSMIGLVVFVIGTVGLINNFLQNYVFQIDQYVYYRGPLGYYECSSSSLAGTPIVKPEPSATGESQPVREVTDEEIAECEAKYDAYNKKESANQTKREYSISIAQVAVGLPLWLLHWGIIQSEYKRRKKEEKK